MQGIRIRGNESAIKGGILMLIRHDMPNTSGKGAASALLVSLIIFLCAMAEAQAVSLPETGQNACYS
jgi:galactokinase/mevalonate kinase-like predicted kinase